MKGIYVNLYLLDLGKLSFTVKLQLFVVGIYVTSNDIFLEEIELKKLLSFLLNCRNLSSNALGGTLPLGLGQKSLVKL